MSGLPINIELIPLLRGTLAGVLSVAAATKIVGSTSLRPFIVATGFRPWVATVVDRSLPGIEALLAIWLLAGVAMKIGTLAAAALFLTFLAVLLVAEVKGVRKRCRCFGLLDGERFRLLSTVRVLLLVFIASWLIGLQLNAPFESATDVRATGYALLIGFLCGIGLTVTFFLLASIGDFAIPQTPRVPAVTRNLLD